MKSRNPALRSLFLTRKKRPGPALWLAGIFGLYCLLVGVAAPHFARPFFEYMLSGELGAHCAIGTLRVNPLTWKIIARNVSVPYPLFVPGTDPPPMPGQDCIRVKSLEFFIDPSSLARRALIAKEVRLVEPRIVITRYPDGSLSPQYFFAAGDHTGTQDADKGADGEPLFPLTVRNATMRNGSVLFQDDLSGAAYDIRNIDAILPFASTLAPDQETPLTPTITALVNGQTVTVTGETRPFAKTRQTVFTLKTRDFSLPELRGYIAPYTALVLEKGSLHTVLTLRLDLDADGAPEFALAGTLEITDLALTGPKGTVFAAQRALVDIENVLLGPRRAVITEALFENPKAVFRRGKDGNVDWASFFTAPAAVAETDVRMIAGEGTELPKPAPGKNTEEKKPEGLPLQLVLGKAAVTGGTVEWHDDSGKEPVRYVAENVEAAFTDVSTEGQGRAEFTLSFGTGTEQAAMRGRATTAPLRADAAVTLRNMPLSPFAPYITEGGGITLHGGRFDASGDVAFHASPENAITIANAAISLADVQVKDARHTAAPLFAAKKIDASNASLDISAKALHIGTLSGSGIAVNIVRGPDGTIILPENRPPAAPRRGGPSSETAEESWKIAVSSLRIENSALSFVDASLRETASIPLTDVTVTGKDFATFDKKEWSVTATGKPGNRGELGITAKGTLAPLRLAFSGTMDKADIRPLSPYLRENTQLSLAEATLGGDFKGTLTRGEKGARETDFAVDGNLGLYGVSLLHGQRELAGWGRMRAENVAFRAPAAGGRSLSASSLTINAPRLSVSIDEHGVNSITKALQPAKSATAPPAKKDNAPSPRFLDRLLIGNAALRQGEAVYVDSRVSPPYVLQVNKVDISLQNVSLEPEKRSPCNASLRVNGSPVTAGGFVSSLFDSPSGNGTITIRSLDLARFTQYAAKYLGYPVRKGELTADITASLKAGRLDMRSRLVITDLELGKKTDSPDAADMPLPTAVAALRDLNGVITLDLPVSGTLGDPHFKISGAVGQMIGNVMVKTVATPFTLLGSLVTGAAGIFTGGSGPDGARIVFAQGGSSLDAAARSAVKNIGTELRKYSSAAVTLTGTADMAEKDLLVDSWVESRLKQMRYDSLPTAQQQKTSPERIIVSPQHNAKEYADLLFALYRSLAFVREAGDPEITSPRSTRAVLRNIRAHYPMGERELILLADARAKAVHAALAGNDGNLAKRIRILPSQLMDSAQTGGRLGSYVHIEAAK